MSEKYTGESTPQPVQPVSLGYTPQSQMQLFPRESVPLDDKFSPNAFRHGFFDCFNPMSRCCMGTWCPCILIGQTHARLQNRSLTREQLPIATGICCGWFTVFLCCNPLQCIFGWMQRGDIRKRYGIEGNCCLDCLAHTFCECCVRPLWCL